jgi:predicted HicB family RNase H-like nuclease
MYPSEEMPRLTLRIPADLKLWLERRAKRECASQNTLIIQALRESQERAAGRTA